MAALGDWHAAHREAVLALETGDAAMAETAAQTLQSLAAQHPGSADLADHLGVALTRFGRFAEAAVHYQRALTLAPTRDETWLNAARNALAANDAAGALAFADGVVALGGATHTEGRRLRCDALRRLGQLDAALAECQQLRQHQPAALDLAEREVDLLLQLGRLSEALAAGERALPQLANPVGLSLRCIEIRRRQGDLAGAIARLDALAQGLSAANATDPALPPILGQRVAWSAYQPELSPQARRQLAQDYGRACLQHVTTYTDWTNSPEPERRLRVGLISGDLRRHAVAFVVGDVLKALAALPDPPQITVYDTLQRNDALSETWRACVHDWVPARDLQGDAFAARLRADGIDIVADLHGHTTGTRLAALAGHPAPVQFSWLGFFGTTGVTAMDYYLADPLCVPTGSEDEFTESLWRMPCSFPFSAPEFAVPLMPPPALSKGFITFGSCNRADKLNDQVLALWARVLTGVDQSRLLIMSPGLERDDYRARFVERLRTAGIDLARTRLLGTQSRERVLCEIYPAVDIALDPFPYSGATTTAEALWAGVPVLARRGDRMVWRMSEAILQQAGLGDWVADDEDDFVARAVRFACDLPRLTQLRARQRDVLRASLMLDAPRFAVQLNEALRGMWQRWCSQQRPSVGAGVRRR